MAKTFADVLPELFLLRAPGLRFVAVPRHARVTLFSIDIDLDLVQISGAGYEDFCDYI